MKQILYFLWCHRTKTLGFIQVTLAVLATTDGIFSPLAVKLILLGSGLTTAWLGFFNSAQSRKDAPVTDGERENPAL